MPARHRGECKGWAAGGGGLGAWPKHWATAVCCGLVALPRRPGVPAAGCPHERALGQWPRAGRDGDCRRGWLGRYLAFLGIGPLRSWGSWLAQVCRGLSPGCRIKVLLVVSWRLWVLRIDQIDRPFFDCVAIQGMDAVMSDDAFRFLHGVTTEDMRIRFPRVTVIAGNQVRFTFCESLLFSVGRLREACVHTTKNDPQALGP
jgi:hypothetical protein